MIECISAEYHIVGLFRGNFFCEFCGLVITHESIYSGIFFVDHSCVCSVSYTAKKIHQNFD